MHAMEKQLERLVCAEHCRYYKPWSTPEPDCGAVHWVHELLRRRPSAIQELERLRGGRLSLPLHRDPLLLRRVCTRCDHYPYNCAYRKPDRDSRGEPCGALLVLDALLDKNAIAPEDLCNSRSRPQKRYA